MQINKKSISKELIIKTTLGLIEENGGIKDVNLRGIAKRIGCNHTNMYNYFDSLDEIFWEALVQVLLNMIDYVDANLEGELDPEYRFYLMISNIIDFTMEHPGWFRLIWLEPLRGEPSSEVINILYKPGESLNAEIIKGSNNMLSQEKASSISNIIHGYVHGELCKWLNNRSFINSKEEMKKLIIFNVKQLYQLLSKGVVEL
jgi:AcrR family transcriptional regulator